MQQRFGATFPKANEYRGGQYNGFSHPLNAVITNEQVDEIDLLQWGLIPHWAKDRSFQKNTLNARMETIHEKPSFRDCVNKRCVIPADGFFEWKWLDEKGKQKEKYFIHLPWEELFGLAGLWSSWVDKSTGELIKSFSILTTEANDLMAEIHNIKKRMPVIILPENKKDWLESANLCMVNDDLVGDRVNLGTLF